MFCKGGLVAHQTATLAGIAAHPKHCHAVSKMQRFKQRKGPFLLLADSLSTALSQARYISPTLRKMAKNSWPGPVTLVFAAKSNYSTACYQQGNIAVRVDADVESRRLAKLCGGLLLSSSLNRHGESTMLLKRAVLRRFSAYIDASLYSSTRQEAAASCIYHISRSGMTRLR